MLVIRVALASDSVRCMNPDSAGQASLQISSPLPPIDNGNFAPRTGAQASFGMRTWSDPQSKIRGSSFAHRVMTVARSVSDHVFIPPIDVVCHGKSLSVCTCVDKPSKECFVQSKGAKRTSDGFSTSGLDKAEEKDKTGEYRPFF